MSHNTFRDTKSLLFLSLAALGVVYGDIGTSPLYAINQIFFGLGKATQSVPDILGGISLVIWAVTLLISIKYIIFVLRADSNGEGGVFALYSLINKLQSKSKWILTGLLIMAAGLLFGDGIITPAISVISSIEGLSVATTAFNPYIVPLTIIILTALFLIQSKGTSKVGGFFGPIIIVWFLSISIFGAIAIKQNPAILLAFNPYFAFHFLFSHSLLAVLLTLGAVMLVITGGEAMYADMGHFGPMPIRLSWFSIVYPSLLLNYLGQGAYLLSGKPVINSNIFFSMIPHIAIYPMVIISTFATIIASQALISGGFSLASQAISLGLFPFFRIVHTHHIHEGQIYVPFINWALYVGCVLLVLFFQSSSHLASAYGIAVSGVMLVTSLSMVTIAKQYWKWKTLFAYAIFVPFAIIDASFLFSNSLKVVEGGYVPLGIGLCLLIVMQTWLWGRNKIKAAFNAYPASTVQQLIRLKKEAAYFIPKTIIIMSPKAILKKEDSLPTLKQLFLERYGLVPYNIIFLNVDQEKVPYVEDNRFEITTFMNDKQKGNITGVKINFGFMENPDVETMLEDLARNHELKIDEDPSTWLIHIIQERPRLEKIANVITRIRYFLFMFLSRNTDTADMYFGLGKEKHLTTEILPVSIQ